MALVVCTLIKTELAKTAPTGMDSIAAYTALIGFGCQNTRGHRVLYVNNTNNQAHGYVRHNRARVDKLAFMHYIPTGRLFFRVMYLPG
jgi:hypothetical protein